MPATTATIRSSKSSTALLCYTGLIAIIASSVLSVDAIRCHQCNTHMDEDCNTLRLITPRAPRDDQYLRDCQYDGEPRNDVVAFCRKTVVKIEVTGEHRIVRNCGWVRDQNERNNTCFSADNEGYLQTICSCTTDGCNAAPPRLGAGNEMLLYSLVCFGILVASLVRRSG